jgi:hypothetical protein
LAARYAVAASSAGGKVTLAVSGVTTYADYAAVISWLEGLELVERADVASVRGDTLTLSLKAKAGAAQLASIIELNRRLVPIPAVGPGLDGPGLDSPGLSIPGPVGPGVAGPVPAVAPGPVGPGPELSYQWQK